jgi:anti-sigma regulatory factor (Ser/Thr protein kinase)
VFAPTVDPRGYVHETAFYASDDDLLAVTVPFLEGGLAAGEATIVAFGGENAELVRREMPDAEGLMFLPGLEQYARPSVTIARYRQLLADLVEGGAGRIRVVGDVPHPGIGVPWEAWSCYEAAVNHVLAEFPLWGLCPYDTRTAPDDVLLDVCRTHPFVTTPDGRHHVNELYEEPTRFLASRTAPPPDALEQRPPSVSLVQPTAAEARHAVADLALRSFLDSAAIENLVVGVSEIVANALQYGVPPVELQAWAVPDRLLVAVTDHGPGPDDPYVGLIPRRAPDSGHGGLGMWIANQLCDQVTLVRDPDRFTVRLVAGRP